MWAIFNKLFLALQIWAITSVRVHTATGKQPPYEIVIIDRMDNMVTLECRDMETQIDFDSWKLYRNGVPENTTDPCICVGNYSNGLLMISSECDGLYSCGVEYTTISGTTTGLVLTRPIDVYAIPKPTTAEPQIVRACIGETVFLPSFIPVSALGNNKVTWFSVEKNKVPAENGVITANYSYKLINVSTSDAGSYIAQVTAPIESTTVVNSPLVELTVTEKPVIESISCFGGVISLLVPSKEKFSFEWKVDGATVINETSTVFPIPPITTPKDIHVQVTVFGECGSTTQTFIILADQFCPPSSPLPSCSSVPSNGELSTTLSVVAVVLVIVLIIIAIIAFAYCYKYVHNLQQKLSTAKVEIDHLKTDNANLQATNVNLQAANVNLQAELNTREMGNSHAHCTHEIEEFQNRLYHTQISSHTEMTIHFKRQNSSEEKSINPIVNVLLEVINLMWHWDNSDVDTLHGVYTFLDLTFKQVCKHHTGVETQKCIFSIKTMVHDLESSLERQNLFSHSTSTPQDESTSFTVTSPQQETRDLDTQETLARRVEDDCTPLLEKVELQEFQHQSRSAPVGMLKLNEYDKFSCLMRKVHQLNKTIEEVESAFNPQKVDVEDTFGETVL